MRGSAQAPLTTGPERILLDRFSATRQAAGRARAVRSAAAAAAFVMALGFAADFVEMSPARLVAGIPNVIDYIVRTLPILRADSLGRDMSEWYWGLHIWLPLLFDTVVIAVLGTSLGVVGAGLLSFFAARNVTCARRFGFLVRRVFEFSRTVPEIVFALIFVYAFGLGAMAGVLAVAIHSFGALGKLFAEVVETVGERSIEGVRAAGANWPQEIRYGVLPQALPEFTSYALLRLEINIRSASVLGFVGAGGIGQELLIAVRQFILPDVSAVVILIIMTVMITDILCQRLRYAIIEGGGASVMRPLQASVGGPDLTEARERFPDVFRAAVRYRLCLVVTCLLALVAFALGVWWAGFSLSRLATGLPRLGWLLQFMFPPSHGGWWREFLYAMAETLTMAVLGTLIAALLAVPVAFLAARNVVGSTFARALLRRGLDTMRGVEALIWALIFVSAVGLGPFAGVLALAASDFPMLAKLVSEAIENASDKPRLGIRATGAGPLQQLRYGLVPQVMPVTCGNILYFIESNTRSATVIGVVGAGGIGMHLVDRIRLNAWSEVAFIIAMMLVAVSLIDWLSRKLRRRLLEPRHLEACEQVFARDPRGTAG